MNARRRVFHQLCRGLFFAVALSALASSPTVARTLQRFRAFGLIVKIDGNALTVSCKEIPGFMDAMEMQLDASDAQQLKNLKPGEMIDFTLVVGDDSPHAEEIRVHRFQSDEQRQLEARCLTIISGAVTGDRSQVENSRAPRMLSVGDKVPDFTLIDQHNQPMKLSDMSGKVVALSFMYTRCSYTQYCLRLSNNLGLVGRRFQNRLGKDLALMTITFDPKNDTPDVLEKYSRNWGAGGNGWYFLTGPADDVKRTCLLFGMNFWPDMGMIAHVMHTVVIDRDGRLLANLEGNEFTADQLGDFLESAMARNPKP
jgi:protein SCO1